MIKIKNVIDKMVNDEEIERYFFANATKYKNLNLWLKPLDEASFFSPSRNPKIIGNIVPRWNVLGFLEAVATQNIEKNDENTEKLLVEIIDEIIKSKGKNDETNYGLIRVLFKLPIKYVEDIHIQLIGNILERTEGNWLFEYEFEKIVIPKLLKEEKKEYLMKLFDMIIDSKIKKSQDFSSEGDYWFKELIDKFGEKLVEVLGVEGLNKILEKIKIIAKGENRFDDIYIPSIEPHSQNSFTENLDYQLVKLVRIFINKLSTKDLKVIISKSLEEEHAIFTRLALYGINQNYNSFRELFWNWFNEAKFTPHLIKHELYRIFERQNSNFSDDEIERIIKWVDKLEYPSLTEDRKEKITAYRKKEWLIPLKDQNEKAKKLYEKYHKINNYVHEYPGFNSWSEIKNGSDSPVDNLEEFMRKSTREVVIFINEKLSSLSHDELYGFNGYHRGLADDFVSYVIRNADEISKNIFVFENLDLYFKEKLISGLERAWNEKIEFNWDKVFDFILGELESIGSIEGEKESIYSIKQYKSSIADLVESGVKSDENAFEKQLLPKAKEVLFQLLEDRVIEDKGNIIVEDEEKEDLIALLLNSFHGKTLSAIINYSLREARISENYIWDEDIKKFLSVELKIRSHYSKFIFSTLGMYLDNLIYLDKEWVLNNFDEIFPIGEEKYWNYSINCYFNSLRRVNPNIYKKLKEGKHLEKLITKKVHKKAIDSICIMYMRDEDNVTIFEILKSSNEEYLQRIGWFIYKNYSENIDENIRGKVRTILEDLKKIYETQKNKKGLIEFSNWIVFFDEIDDELYDFLKLVYREKIKSYRDQETLKGFIRLSKISESNEKKISELYLEMMKNENLLIYPMEKVKILLEILKKNNKKNVTKIVNLYNQNGIYAFKDIVLD